MSIVVDCAVSTVAMPAAYIRDMEYLENSDPAYREIDSVLCFVF